MHVNILIIMILKEQNDISSWDTDSIYHRYAYILLFRYIQKFYMIRIISFLHL